MEQVKKFELKRQIFHLFLGIAIVMLLRYSLINTKIILFILIIGLVISYLSRKMRIPFFNDMLEIFERKEEITRFPGKGIIFYFIGVYITLLLFPKDIASASIMILALGDSVSHVFGLHFGKIKHILSEKKFLEGTIAGFIAGFFGAVLFVKPTEAFFASLIAMTVEAIEIKAGAQQVDDNLVVPIVSGGVVWVLRFLIH